MTKKKGRQKDSTLLLEYRSWIIEVDNSFPSYNYTVKKKNDTKFRHVAYCGTLESALNQIFHIMLLDYVNKKNNYGGKIQELRNAILETKKQFKALLDISPILRTGIKGGEKQNDSN